MQKLLNRGHHEMKWNKPWDLLIKQCWFWYLLDNFNTVIDVKWCSLLTRAKLPHSHHKSQTIITGSAWGGERLREDLHVAFHNLAASYGQITPLFWTAEDAKDASSPCQVLTVLTHDRGQKILPTSPNSERQLRSKSQEALVMCSNNKKKSTNHMPAGVEVTF